ncbi:hypothetical protein QBC36DRAFT_307605 [Triangularia setosa]|uniref:Uncharacterized protein n=1 Tax=Triangularia setosa TaxID=2587417 RepID=A0AAN6WGM2_9PEZI|nr:hypothetical protein QBC36DRAFT_307605 [Podospora setosa]
MEEARSTYPNGGPPPNNSSRLHQRKGFASRRQKMPQNHSNKLKQPVQLCCHHENDDNPESCDVAVQQIIAHDSTPRTSWMNLADLMSSLEPHWDSYNLGSSSTCGLGHTNKLLNTGGSTLGPEERGTESEAAFTSLADDLVRRWKISDFGEARTEYTLSHTHVSVDTPQGLNTEERPPFGPHTQASLGHLGQNTDERTACEDAATTSLEGNFWTWKNFLSNLVRLGMMPNLETIARQRQPQFGMDTLGTYLPIWNSLLHKESI